MDAINTELRQQAVSLGLCNQWQNMWNSDWDEETMYEKMYKGLDFCIKHHWPSNDFIKKHFQQKSRWANGIYVDEKRSGSNHKHSLILGASDVILRYNGPDAGEVYVRDTSELTITARTRSFVIVHVYDKATVEASSFDLAKIVIIKHSKNCVIETTDSNVKIKNEY